MGEALEIQEQNPDSVSAWKDVLWRYSDKAIQAIWKWEMRTWDSLIDDRRQRAALEIEFNRKVDSWKIEDDVSWTCNKCGCAIYECEC